MKKIFIVILLFTLSGNAYSQIWMSRTASIQFFSETPMENIDGNTKTAMAAINTQTGTIFFKAVITSFDFKKSLMKEHFNENYLESDKFPTAEFNGVIETMPDLSKEGTYQVSVKGKLIIHGVTKERTVPATIIVSKGQITSSSKFKVKCVDHNIEIPKLLVTNIAEELEVTVNCTYLPKQ